MLLLEFPVVSRFEPSPAANEILRNLVDVGVLSNIQQSPATNSPGDPTGCWRELQQQQIFTWRVNG